MMLTAAIAKRPLLAMLVATLCLAAPAYSKEAKGGGKSGGGAAMTAGSVELGLSGLVDVDPDDATAVYFDVTLGYYVFQGFELGIQTLQGTTRTGQRDTSGLFAQYDWLNSTMLVPFAGMAIKHAAAPTGIDQKAAKIGALFGGLKLMAASNVAFAMTFVYEFADHSSLGPEGARKRRNRELNFGFKFYF